MTAATAAPQPGIPGWLPVAGAVLGLLSLVGFVVAGLRRAAPFIDPRLLVEIRWLRSAGAVFVQQSSLAAVLVGVPLYLTGVVGLSVSVTGLLVFCLPLVWAVAAPLVGLLADRVGPRPVLRTGLALLALVDLGLAVVLGAGVTHLAPLIALMLAAGTAIALVQTPALTGATRSPAGQRGAGLGLFNMMRFVGAADRDRRGGRRLARRPALAVRHLCRGGRGRSRPQLPRPRDARPGGSGARTGQCGLTTRSTSAVVLASRSRVCASHTANWLSACRRSMLSSREARSSL